ncbi:hypothetical protein [Microbacterium sp. NPDC087665]|uniref:hypothetical protein n=1 Tax=Microbacterium sp. NPDC087665 TaxID=3364194 RepID=UPI00380B2ACC
MGDKLGDAIGPALRRSFDDTPVHLKGVPRVINRLTDKKSRDRDGVHEVDRYDGSNHDVSRSPNPNHPGRDQGGRYNGDGSKPWDDKQALGVEKYAKEANVEVITTEVHVVFDGSPQPWRTYDGLIRNADGPNTYDGLEIKSGNAAARYFSETPSNTQGAFDRAVLAGTPARGKMDGMDILVTNVIVRVVP